MTATRLCACCSVLCFVLTAQSDQKKLRKELEGPYHRWIDQDVAYIITEPERKAFNQLQNDDEREQFVEQFWLRRDPTPDTQENEFKEEHYRRIAHANERFASGIPGWRTDRGRIYITFGPPDEIESHPSGGAYQRPMEQGAGSSVAYPFEVWRYRYIEGIGSNIMIEFVDPTMTGEYRMTIDPSEKDALAHVAPAAPCNSCPPPTSNEFDRLKLFADLHRPPAVKFKDLEALVTSSVRFNTLPMKVRVDSLRLTESTALTPVTIQFEHDGVKAPTVNLYMRVTSITGHLINIAEDVINSAIYQRAFYLPPGMYRLNVIAKDVTTGNVGISDIAVRVPQFEPDKLSASNIILADAIERVPSRSLGSGQFVLGPWKVRPRVSASFTHDERVGIYFQIYGTGETPNGSLQYQVIKAGANQPAIDFTEEMSDMTVVKLLPLWTLELGDYTLKVTITDRNHNQVLTPSATFSVR